MTADSIPQSANKPSAIFSGSLIAIVFRLVALAAIDAFTIWFVSKLASDEEWILAGFLAVVTLGINAVFLIDGLYPYRWFAPGLTLLILMLIYPTVYTIYVAFTNYRDGNLLTRSQAEEVLQKPVYLPPDTVTYSWTAFRSTEDPDTYGLWLIPDKEETGDVIFATSGEITPASEIDLGEYELDEDSIPTGLPDYQRLSKGDVFKIMDSVLSKIQFGEPDNVIQLNPARIQQAGVFRQKYTVNTDGSLYDNETGVTYEAKQGSYTPISGPNMIEGTVVDAEGQPLPVIRPGYYVVTGLSNFKRLIQNDRIRGPFVRVFIWTFAHAFFTVFLTFCFGLFMAILLNVKFTPGRAVLRTLLLVPYSLPAFISVLVWKGLLNEQLGVINKVISQTINLPDSELNWVWNYLSRPALLLLALSVVYLTVRAFRGRAWLSFSIGLLGLVPAMVLLLLWTKNPWPDVLEITGPKWTSSPTWVKGGILLIQLWLGFPYMMLICTGALQSIPSDIYEAARVDGANVLQQFRHLTLPLLLVAVGPLLIASFAFNFNNFTIVELFNKGGPPISPDTPAGHSDILITYTYELAFGSGRGADYGFATTISLVIFFIVAIITFFNFRFTQSWEEISENV
jgi:ABC-type sugar transport system permease subunit